MTEKQITDEFAVVRGKDIIAGPYIDRESASRSRDAMNDQAVSIGLTADLELASVQVTRTTSYAKVTVIDDVIAELTDEEITDENAGTVIDTEGNEHTGSIPADAATE